MSEVLAFALGLSAIGWAGAGIAGVYALGRVPLLPPLPAPPPRLPRVSVIVPARDEAERIAGTLARLLAQQHVELEIVVVDDRSRDATAAIVERAAAADQRARLERAAMDGARGDTAAADNAPCGADSAQRVKLVRVTELPPGWLGKSHACERGARSSSGEWLLFTDGDIFLAPDVLARALAHAAREEADHIVLAPSVEGQSFAARAATAAFGATMLPLLAAANADRKGAGIGIGAFNLVKKSAWEAVGGHQQLKLEVVDDIGLGILLAREGFRTRACFAAHEVAADWARRLRDVPRALEKNMFAQLDYSLPKALVASLAAILFGLAPFAGLAAGLCAEGWTARAGWLAFGAMFCTIPASVKGARITGSGLWPALASPLFFFALPWAMLNSTFKTLARGGVRWRDTFHPLAELRAGRLR
ncbi:MAG: glycosyltransferase [Planctomycetes bacterium]|nr:glycosyltransferase [Planctomycetota bacterium]